MSGTVPPGLRVLKVLVVVMGVLIVAGIAVIGVTIANRLSDAASKATAAEAIDAARIGDIAVSLPPGTRIVETVVTDTRLTLRTDGADGPRIYLFHLPSGEPLGSIRVDR